MSQNTYINISSGSSESIADLDNKTYDGEVLTYADLPDATTNAGLIYLVETQTGSLLAFNRKKAGLYRSDGTTWNPFNDLVASSIEVDDTNIGSGSNILQNVLEFLASNSSNTLNWIDLATNAKPVSVKTISIGEVLSYTYSGVTRYRLVPSPYNYNQDSFYENFDESTDTLSNLIVSRGA